jgi:hypothetical protein
MATNRERNQGKAKFEVIRQQRKEAKQAEDNHPPTDPEDLPFEPLPEKKQ